MNLSIVIPVLNDADAVARAVERASRAGVGEVIVVDGGSTDGSAEAAAAAGAQVLLTTPSRGGQQNCGARAATGDTLLFLHADTALPTDFPRVVEEILAKPGVAAGAFGFQLDSSGWRSRLVERMVDLRCALFQAPYGDQAIFVRAATFWAAGGFPDAPIMEDYELVRQLRRLGRVVTAQARAATSARRWRKLGLWKATWSNQACIAAYRLKVPPERIARWRASLNSN